MRKPYLSVIVTSYNESDNLRSGALDQIDSYLRQAPFSYEIVLVDDGSTDDTLKLLRVFAARHKNARVIHNPHMGKAAGVITGALSGRGEVILFTDTDQSTPITEFDKFLPHLKSGSQVVIGSRPSRPGAPFYRQVLAYGMVLMRTLVLRLPYRDTQCGFKAFTGPAAVRIFTILKSVHPANPISYPTTNPGFDLEILFLSRRLHLRVSEVSVSWFYRESKRVTFIKDAVNGMRELFLVRYRGLTNAYGI